MREPGDTCVRLRFRMRIRKNVARQHRAITTKMTTTEPAIEPCTLEHSSAGEKACALCFVCDRDLLVLNNSCVQRQDTDAKLHL